MNRTSSAVQQHGYSLDSASICFASRKPETSLAARLLNATDACRYLGFKSAELLKNIPVKPIHLSVVGVGRAPRWDRLALDRWLDTLSGLNGPWPEVTEDGVDAEFDAWKAGRHGR